jgi:hypothetical protein
MNAHTAEVPNFLFLDDFKFAEGHAGSLNFFLSCLTTLMRCTNVDKEGNREFSTVA